MSQLKDLLHDSLISTSHVEKCALLDKENYSVKASSVGYEVSSVFIFIYKKNFSPKPTTKVSATKSKSTSFLGVCPTWGNSFWTYFL